MATQVQTPTAPAFSEAPASATVEAYDGSGRRWLLTTRAATTSKLLTRLPVLTGWLDDHGWQARTPGKASQGDAATGENAPLCAIHKTPMTRRTKDGRSWWSCSHKLDDGSYCPYRPKAGQP
jgi:hypothetical protein